MNANTVVPEGGLSPGGGRVRDYVSCQISMEGFLDPQCSPSTLHNPCQSTGLGHLHRFICLSILGRELLRLGPMSLSPVFPMVSMGPGT